VPSLRLRESHVVYGGRAAPWSADVPHDVEEPVVGLHNEKLCPVWCEGGSARVVAAVECPPLGSLPLSSTMPAVNLHDVDDSAAARRNVMEHCPV
jgi:hypothetical protein